MKLRIARKMDRGNWQRARIDDSDKRPWWSVYSDGQLLRAEHRLRRSWSRACPIQPDRTRNVTEDWFRANRVNSRRVRQRALRALRRLAGVRL